MQALIDKWYAKIRPYILKYKDGFFELPFIGNSPHLMWESFKKMPYCSFQESTNSIVVDNPFLKGVVYYHELEDGLVWIHSTLFFKQNIIFKQIFSKQHPPKHYCINCLVSQPGQKNTKTILQDLHFDGQLWFMLKPGAGVKNFHFKNTSSESINFYFTQSWYNNYKRKHGHSGNKLNQFMLSKQQLLSIDLDQHELGQSILAKVRLNMEKFDRLGRTEPFNELAISLMQFFETNCIQDIDNEKYFTISNTDRIKLIKTIELLNNHIQGKFPGIEFIAAEVLLSETKLKALFKEVHGTTLFEFFQQQKMTAAKAMLDSNEQSVASVAAHFGYENAGKFTAAFKKHFNYLPSQSSPLLSEKSN
jgi:AraC-like DNA-binding protein